MNLSTLFGMQIVISPDRARYVLPEEVLPGIPWPPGFRQEFNAWSKGFLGTWNMLKPDTYYLLNSKTIVAHPIAYANMKAAFASSVRAL